jgi:opacity protein-like surface antigen
MNFMRATFAGAALLVGGIASAQAADLYGGSVKDGYAPMPVSTPSSWYVRVDGGYSFNTTPSISDTGGYTLYDTNMQDTWSVGAGIGRYFTRNIRGDITWDHRFEGDITGATTASTFAPFDPSAYAFSVKRDVFLANLYYDFDARGRFTPYIGFGLGTSYNQVSSGSILSGCACTGEFDSKSNWSFAGALMAGFSINLGGTTSSYGGSIKDAPVMVDERGRWNLDFGYRALYIGDSHTGQIYNVNSPSGPSYGNLKVEDSWSHEMRLGLRYDIR